MTQHAHRRVERLDLNLHHRVHDRSRASLLLSRIDVAEGNRIRAHGWRVRLREALLRFHGYTSTQERGAPPEH